MNAFSEWNSFICRRLTVWRSLKKLKIELLYDSTIPLLGIYLEKNHNSKRYMNPIFISVLFTIDRRRKQPNIHQQRNRQRRCDTYILCNIPTPQFKSINSLALSILHSPTLTSIHDHRKNHSLD